MPSIALRGLVKAERVHTDKRGNEQAAILAPFLYVGSPNPNVIAVVYLR